MALVYIPDKGDIVWLNLEPHLGHEQAGIRPMLVLSPFFYNRKSVLAVFCPITSQKKNYPFEVQIPEGLEVKGVILADQIKSLDFAARNIRFICKLPDEQIEEVKQKLSVLLE
jgi:mRNA interferase MazF